LVMLPLPPSKAKTVMVVAQVREQQRAGAGTSFN